MAIKKSLLIHEGTLKTNIVKDLGVIASSTDYTLKDIRIERNTISRFGALGDLDSSKLLIFYDARNSKAYGVNEEDEVVLVNLIFTQANLGDMFVDSWDNQTYTIRNIMPIYAHRKLHHYEIELN